MKLIRLRMVLFVGSVNLVRFYGCVRRGRRSRFAHYDGGGCADAKSFGGTGLHRELL